MVTNRLIWYLEPNNLIVYVQSGLHGDDVTFNHLVSLTFQRETFIKFMSLNDLHEFCHTFH